MKNYAQATEMQPEQDAKVSPTPLLDRMATVTNALEELGEEIARILFERLERVNAPLREEIAALAARAETLRESFASLQRRVEARLRLLATAVDEAVASGRDDQAELKRTEATELEANLKNVQAEADHCDTRRLELERKCDQNIHLVFEQTYSEIRRATVSMCTGTAGVLDRAWEAITRYGGPVQGLAIMRYKADLTPDENGEEKQAFWSLKRWFQGRI